MVFAPSEMPMQGAQGSPNGRPTIRVNTTLSSPTVIVNWIKKGYRSTND